MFEKSRFQDIPNLFLFLRSKIVLDLWKETTRTCESIKHASSPSNQRVSATGVAAPH